MSVLARFEAKFVRGSADECWPWTGSRTTDGYGTFRVGRAVVRAHRFSYSTYVGPIPPGLHVLHSCDNPPCVNPGHLFPGTNAENTADRDAKGRTQHHGRGGTRGAKNSRSKLNPEIAATIRAAHRGGESMRSLGRRYGVCHGTVGDIIAGRTWSTP